MRYSILHGKKRTNIRMDYENCHEIKVQLLKTVANSCFVAAL